MLALAWLDVAGCGWRREWVEGFACAGGSTEVERAVERSQTASALTLSSPLLSGWLQFYLILKLQQGVWPELPWVHIWDYARWVLGAALRHAVLYC